MMSSTRKVGQKSQRLQHEEDLTDSSARPNKSLKKAKKAGTPKDLDKFEKIDIRQKAAERPSETNEFFMSSSLNEVLLPICEQQRSSKELIQNSAQYSFEKSVPYVFSYDKKSKLNVVYNLEGYTEFVYQEMPHEKQVDLVSGLWRNNFSSSWFYAFLDENSPAIPLGSIEDLRKKGFIEENLLNTLLTPTAEPRKAQALFLFLSEEGLISEKFKPFEDSVRRKLDSRSIVNEKEELLIDFAGSSSSILMKKLLDQNVSPDAFSALFGVHAINVAKNRERKENIKLLIEYGADPNAEEQDPIC